MIPCHAKPFPQRIHSYDGYDERAPQALLVLVLVLAALAGAGVLLAIAAPAPPIGLPYFTT